MNEGKDKKGSGSSNKLFSNETECLLVETFSLRVQGRYCKLPVDWKKLNRILVILVKRSKDGCYSVPLP